MKNDKIIEELKKQLELIKYDRSKILSEQNIISEIGLDGGGDQSTAGGRYSREYRDAMEQGKKNKTEYQKLDENPDAWHIADLIKRSMGIATDNECWTQYAFNKIKNEEQYYEVGKWLRYDPYDYIEDDVNTSDNPCGMRGVTTIQIKWKSLGSINYPYGFLKKYPTSKNIVKILTEAKGSGFGDGDREAWAQAAMEAIKTKDQYYEVTALLNDDPINFCKNTIGMDLNDDYLRGTAPSLTGWLPDVGKSDKGDLGFTLQKLGVEEYPYGVLKKNPTVPLMAKVLNESAGILTYDKPAWMEAVFNAMIQDPLASPRIFAEVSKEMGKDAYTYTQYYIKTNTKYNDSDYYKTIGQCYDIIKNNNKGLSMYYEFGIGSPAMYHILQSQNATPQYVADVLNKCKNYTSTKVSSTLGSIWWPFEDLEAVAVAAFMAIPDMTFYNQVKEHMRFTSVINVDFDDPYKWVTDFVDADEPYHAGTSLAQQWSRIQKAKPLVNNVVESEEELQKAIDDVTTKGFFSLTTYEDCKTKNQIYYKAYIYGLKKISEDMESKRNKMYGAGGDEKVPATGYPSCLNVNNASISGLQDLDEKRTITCGAFSTTDMIVEECFTTLSEYLSSEDQEYVEKNDPNMVNLNSENMYILRDFIDNWGVIETQYKEHFERKDTIECGLFPQGPVKFFDYWFQTEDYNEARSRALLTGPKIYCQAGVLKSNKTLKTGLAASIEETKGTLHIILPVISLFLSFFGGAGLVVGALFELADAAIYKYIDEDEYMAGLSICFALLGPLDAGLGAIFAKAGNWGKLIEVYAKFNKGERALTYSSEFIQAVRIVSRNVRKLKTIFEYLTVFGLLRKGLSIAIKDGANGFILFLDKLFKAGYISEKFITKMGIMIGGTFYAWDWIAHNVYGLCNTLNFAEAAKYKNDSPEAHWWITNLFIQAVSKTQTSTKPCPETENNLPLSELNKFKEMVNKKLRSDFDNIINGKETLVVGSIGGVVKRIQLLLETLNMNKNFSVLESGSFLDLSLFKDTGISGFLKNLGFQKNECSFMMDILQIYPQDNKKKIGPYKTLIYFNKNNRPKKGFFKKGDEIRIENTNFDGIYKIESVTEKNLLIQAITVSIPYKSKIQKNQITDNSFSNRGIISPKILGLDCIPKKQPKKIIFESSVYNEDMKQAIINYQIKNQIYPYDGLVGVETAKQLKIDFLANINKIAKLTEKEKEFFTLEEGEAITNELVEIIKQKLPKIEEVRKAAEDEINKLKQSQREQQIMLDVSKEMLSNKSLDFSSISEKMGLKEKLNESEVKDTLKIVLPLLKDSLDNN
jgi:hypothetical protein